jgi:hypothetical protein
MHNREILYLLMKMKFFDLLFNLKDTVAAGGYYFDYFIHLGKETRKNWERKNQSFLKLLKNPSILKDKNVFAKNSDDFMLELNRALYKYLYENSSNKFWEKEEEFSHADSGMIKERSNSDFNESYLGLGTYNHLNFPSNENSNILVDDVNLPNQTNNFNFLRSRKNTNFEMNFPLLANNQNPNNCNTLNQNQEEIKDLSQFSTKEEFSDFEEEIENHQACEDQARENLITLNSFIPNPNNRENISRAINNSLVPSVPNTRHLSLINQNFLEFIEKQNSAKNLFLKPLPSSHLVHSDNFQNDKNCTNNIYTKEFIPKTPKNSENLQKKLPMLQSFKPKYTKRENIDKKILRKFKVFLKERHNDKMLLIPGSSSEKHFWVMFLNGNLFPPMKYTDGSTGEQVEFKSFNTKYLLWIFSKKGAKEFYEKFTQEEGSAVIANISSDYGVHESSDLNQLEYYMNNFSFIFDLNSVATTKVRSASGNDSSLLCPGNFNQAPTPMSQINNFEEISKPTFNLSK